MFIFLRKEEGPRKARPSPAQQEEALPIQQNNPSNPGWVKEKNETQNEDVADVSAEEMSQKKVVVRKIPKGSRFIGKLMSPLDTRTLPEEVRAILIYDLKSQNGIVLKKKTQFIGQAVYPGKGDRVLVIFHQVQSIDGEINRIKAHASDAKDYRSGVQGKFHSDRPYKTASRLGLNVLSGVTEGFAQGLIGETGSRLKGAALHGVSRAADSEIENRVGELESAQPYVTVDEGKEIIITLDKDLM